MYEVIVLFEGYSLDKGTHMLANCSCTLLKGKNNIIIDTLTPWDGPKLIEALGKNGLTCEDINFVICSHGHSDHVGCNYLFQKATHIVGYCISFQDTYKYNNLVEGEPYIIDEYIKVIPTPGHTLQDVSVIVNRNSNVEGVLAITGDLFEKAEDLIDDTIWISSGSDNIETQRLNRMKILELADWIIPGHGPIFKVPDNYKLNKKDVVINN